MGSAIVWFRDDLRLRDNPALSAAIASGRPLHCLYVLDDETQGQARLGAARRWWLHHSLAKLSEALDRLGGRLTLRRGGAVRVLPEIVAEAGADALFWNRRYGRAERATDADLKTTLHGKGVAVSSFNGALLHEPWEVTGRTGERFRVFSPFWRAALARGEPRPPLPAPPRIDAAPGLPSLTLADLDLLPTAPDWSGGLAASWNPGEDAAATGLAAFLDGGARDYARDRDRPDRPSTSMLSPHLAAGEISPVTIWHAVRHAVEARSIADRDADKFLAEIGWREFSYHLLYHEEDLASVNVQRRFDSFPWRRDDAAFRAWRRGLTGYPIVDAGMRQLWRTGWMHNRVRMIVASFLIKHLLIDWRLGEAWFRDTLVDADPASNAASWQWVAGSGADAAPYFRIFNPILQGVKFDPDGTYVRRFVPEIARMPADFIHEPWTAPVSVRDAAGLRLGETYPQPIVDHAAARDRALGAFQSLASAA